MIWAGGLTQPSAQTLHNEDQMNDTNLEEALQLFNQPVPAPTMTEYQLEQQRIRANYERLKAERLAREAAANKPT
jgi:hypothetical protein